MYVPLHGDLDGSRPGAAETEEVRHNKETHCKRTKERDNIFKMSVIARTTAQQSPGTRLGKKRM